MYLSGGRRSGRKYWVLVDVVAKLLQVSPWLSFCYFCCLPPSCQLTWVGLPFNMLVLLPFHTRKMIWQPKRTEKKEARVPLYRSENTWNISHIMLEYQFQQCNLSTLFDDKMIGKYQEMRNKNLLLMNS